MKAFLKIDYNSEEFYEFEIDFTAKYKTSLMYSIDQSGSFDNQPFCITVKLPVDLNNKSFQPFLGSLIGRSLEKGWSIWHIQPSSSKSPGAKLPSFHQLNYPINYESVSGDLSAELVSLFTPDLEVLELEFSKPISVKLNNLSALNTLSVEDFKEDFNEMLNFKSDAVKSLSDDQPRRDGFLAYLNGISAPRSNMPPSYVKGLDILSEMLDLFPKGFSDCKDIWSVESLDRLQELYQVALGERKKGHTSEWHNKRFPASYLSKGFISAALNKYIEYLGLLKDSHKTASLLEFQVLGAFKKEGFVPLDSFKSKLGDFCIPSLDLVVECKSFSNPVSKAALREAILAYSRKLDEGQAKYSSQLFVFSMPDADETFLGLIDDDIFQECAAKGLYFCSFAYVKDLVGVITRRSGLHLALSELSILPESEISAHAKNESDLISTTQDYTKTANIYCMLSLHFLLSMREDLLDELRNCPSQYQQYFEGSASKYIDNVSFSRGLEAKGNDLDCLAQLKELVFEVMPYFSYMTRIAPEVASFVKSILFEIDVPERFVASYKVACLALSSSFSSDSFGPEHIANVLRILRALSVEDCPKKADLIAVFKDSISNTKPICDEDLYFLAHKHSTPAQVIDHALDLLPNNGRDLKKIHDPACGIGGFLFKMLEKRFYDPEGMGKDFDIFSITGCDCDQISVNLAKIGFLSVLYFDVRSGSGYSITTEREFLEFDIIGKVSPNICLASEDAFPVTGENIFCNSSNVPDFLYCDAPFDKGLSHRNKHGFQYNHQAFASAAMSYPFSIVVLPESFARSKRDGIVRNWLVEDDERRLTEVHFYESTKDQFSKIFLLSDQSRNKAKEIHFYRTSSKARGNSPLLVSPEAFDKNSVYSFLPDDLPVTSSNKNEQSLFAQEFVKATKEQLEAALSGVSTMQEILNSEDFGKPEEAELGEVVKLYQTERFEQESGLPQRFCFIPFNHGDRSLAVFGQSEKGFLGHSRYKRYEGAGIFLPLSQGLDAQFFYFWLKYNPMLRPPRPFSRAGRSISRDYYKDSTFDYSVDGLFKRLLLSKIVIPPLATQSKIAICMENEELQRYFRSSVMQGNQPKSLRSSRGRIKLQEILFRYD